MNLPAILLGLAIIIYGIYGIIKKKIFPPWAFRAGNRFIIDASKNHPFMQKQKLSNYVIYGAWAVTTGIILTLLGIVILLTGFRIVLP